MEFAMKRINRNVLLAGVCLTGLFLFTPRTAGAESGLYVLNPAGEAEFSGTVDVEAGNLYVNGVFNPFGDATVIANVANVGSVTNADAFTGTLNTGVTNTADPLALLPTPTWDPAADLGSVNLSGGHVRLSPGFYSGGISLTSSASAWLEPGLYILDGAGFDIGGQASVRGVGVTLFITGEGSVDMTGQGVVDLSPSFGGVYNDIMVFVDRDIEDGLIDLSGGGEFRMNGILYAPSSMVDIVGASGLGGDPVFGFTIICDTLRLSGMGTVSFIRRPMPSEAFD